jgi:hypothetical protein
MTSYQEIIQGERCWRGDHQSPSCRNQVPIICCYFAAAVAATAAVVLELMTNSNVKYSIIGPSS